MRVAFRIIFNWFKFQSALFGFGKAISAGHGPSEHGAFVSIDEEGWATIGLADEESFDSAEPWFEIIRRRWERGKPKSLKRFKATFFSNLALCDSGRVSHERDFEAE